MDGWTGWVFFFGAVYVVTRACMSITRLLTYLLPWHSKQVGIYSILSPEVI